MLAFERGGVVILNHIIKGEGSDIIFLHGWGGSIDSFRGVFEVFSKKYRCTALDFYGFGESKLPSALTLEDYAKGVEEIIEKYDMSDIILVGHSFGGRVAILLAARTDKIKSIVLVDSAGLKPRNTVKKSIRKLTYKLKKLMKIDTSKCGSSDYRALSGDMRETFKNVVNFYLDGYLKYIKCDALIIWGKKDKDTPPYMARRLNRGIYNSGLIFLEGGHYSYLDCYPQFLAILDSYFNDICK
ncbi:MAG: alpha/beta hydrolase [Clostridia bacterium]|nr:alpha/beta hydrolase [Clostridia bacterium]